MFWFNETGEMLSILNGGKKELTAMLVAMSAPFRYRWNMPRDLQIEAGRLCGKYRGCGQDSWAQYKKYK